MGVSRVAVSRQIAELEEAIGQQLFVRNHRTVTLTRQGEAFAASVGPAMQTIGEALDRHRRATGLRRISVTVTTAFATYWLMPRLIDFGARHPDIEVNLVVSDRYLDLEAEAIDVAVRYTPDVPTASGWSPLMQETILPVYSPRYEPRTALERVEDLLNERLLYLSGRYRPEAGWNHWFSRHGLLAPEAGSKVLVNTYINMLQAAIEGQGIALAGRPLVDRYLEDGTLLTPPAIAPLQRDNYYLFLRPGQESAVTFGAWIGAQMTGDQPRSATS